MTERSAISALALSTGYRRRGVRREVLAGIDLDAVHGELVCLVGPNGAGKSTLLRTMAGVQKPLSGVLRLDGREATSLGAIERARIVGIVHTERIDVGALTARKVVSLGRYPHIGWGGRLGPKDRQAVDWALDAVGATALADRDMNELSDGEQQRINIARALAQKPSILILDEPTAFLDLPARVELMGVLRRLAREEGLAVVASTHDLDLALRTADTLWVIVPGPRIVRGAPEDLILAGVIGAAFASSRVAFRPEERTFRPRIEGRWTATVRGTGLRAILAGALLEREGVALLDLPAAATFAVTADADQWTLTGEAKALSGRSFAELATAVRQFAS